MTRRNPLYHGTSRDFRLFRRTISEWSPGLGIWMTDDRSAAEYFSRESARRLSEAPQVLTVDVPQVNLKSYADWVDFIEAFKSMRPAARMRRTLMRQGFGGIEIRASTTDTMQKTPRRDVCIFNPRLVRIALRELM